MNYIWAFYVLAAIVVAVTLLPLWRTKRGWVRILEFPRLQIAAAAILTLIALLAWTWPASPPEVLLPVALALCATWQLSHVWRYLPGAPVEVPQTSEGVDAAHSVCFLATNVLQSSRDVSGLLSTIREADPDVIMAVETDDWWCSALAAALDGAYQHSLKFPLSNGYGMALFSRLELVDSLVRFVSDERIPSIKAEIRFPSGQTIDFYGVHPQPPLPSKSSEQRDEELVLVGREIARLRRPAVLLGDLNDVAWSATTARFKAASNLRDPRRGRGLFNTYPAGMPGLRYPLDHVFLTPHFTVTKMRVLPRFRSDHLPLLVKLHLTSAQRA